MKPDGQAQGSPPVPASGSDWQQQALAAVHTNPQQASVARPANAAPSSVPDWQRGFVHQGGRPNTQTDVPDMLAAADSKGAQPEAPVPDMLAAADPPKHQPIPQPPESPAALYPGMPTGPGVVMGSFGDDIPAGAVTGTGGASSMKKLVIGVIAFVLVVAIAAGVYLFLGRDSDRSGKGTANSQAATPAVDMSDLNSVTFQAPELAGFTSVPESTAGMVSYASADRTCHLSFGIVSAQDAAGATIDEILSAITRLRGAGVTVDGPNPGTALVLKDAADSSKLYSMPTYTYALSEANKRGVIFYSVVLLKGGEGAVVSRECTLETDQSVPESSIRAVEQAAKKLTVDVR